MRAAVAYLRDVWRLAFAGVVTSESCISCGGRYFRSPLAGPGHRCGTCALEASRRRGKVDD